MPDSCFKNKSERAAAFEAADLYVVISSEFTLGRPVMEIFEAAASAGVTLIQLREKEKGKKFLYDLAVACRPVANRYGILLMIDDHVDVALAAGADGVHLGQEDLPIEAARAMASELWLGNSTHNLEEARAARLNSQNLALSEADRKAAVEKADAKARQVSQKEAEIELYATEGSASLRKVEQQKREAIMAEIQQEIRRRAAAEGYAFVLDSSGKTMNEQPTLLIYPESCDFTAAVLTELNRTRTRKADTPSSKPAPPPEPVRN